MNKNSEHDLILLRKKISKLRPPSGELVQGVFFSALNAEDKLKAAKLLFENNMHSSGFALLLTAVEEIGKITQFVDILVSWSTLKKASSFKNKQKNHAWKLGNALKLFIQLITQKTGTKSDSFLTTLYGKDEKFKKYIDGLDAKSASKLHATRLRTSYTNFDGRMVTSPHHFSSEIEIETCKLIIDHLLHLSEIFSKLCDLFLGIYISPIRKCFFEKDRKKIRALKKEINRRVDRTMPAFRQYVDTFVIKKTGISILDIGTIPKNFWDGLSPSEEQMRAHIRKVRDLITSHEKLDEKYVFPPLKDSAKNAYALLSVELLEHTRKRPKSR